MIATQIKATATKAKTLTIFNYKEENLDVLAKSDPSLAMIRISNLTFNSNFSFTASILNMLNAQSSTLTQLSISYLHYVDIQGIVANCPNLTMLVLEVFNNIQNNFKMKVKPLEHIETLIIRHAPKFHNYMSLQYNIHHCNWTALLAKAKKLQRLDIQSADCDGLKFALNEIYEEHEFENLKMLTLIDCHSIQLSDLQPMLKNLKHLRLRCKDISKAEIDEIRKKYNMD